MKFFVTCARGTEGALRRELVDLRIRAPRGATGGVSFEGPFEDGIRACVWSRVAMRVLLEVGAFEAHDADALYAGVRAIDWAQHLDARATFAVSAHVQDNPALTHSGFVALKVKDGIVDRLRDRLGARPDVAPHDPDVAVFLHLRASEARVYLDLAGEPLHRRGYRREMSEAPLKESLAAAILSLGGVDPTLPFVDPMCGSGTLAIEHALRARDLAPGLNRRFGFERWPSREHARAAQTIRDDARARARAQAPASILARDLDPAVLEACRRNARAAGVERDIRFETGDIRTWAPSGPPGTICVNPPYGARLALDGGERERGRPAGHERHRPPRRGAGPGGRDRFARPGPTHAPGSRGAHAPARDEALPGLYRDMARIFSRLPAWRIVVLSGNPQFSRVLWRKPDVSHRLWNGPLEARLLVFEADAGGT